jgi:hypothetical protein
MTIYQENGFNNRTEYLRSLSEEYDLPFSTVAMLASALGPNEDFDGLVTTLEDEAERICF